MDRLDNLTEPRRLVIDLVTDSPPAREDRDRLGERFLSEVAEHFESCRLRAKIEDEIVIGSGKFER